MSKLVENGVFGNANDPNFGKPCYVEVEDDPNGVEFPDGKRYKVIDGTPVVGKAKAAEKTEEKPAKKAEPKPKTAEE